MRNIKYRQFVNGKFHYWGYINQSENGKPEFTGPIKPLDGSFVDSDRFTGLKDRNGVDIYESSEIDNGFIVSVKGCDYVLISISCGDIVRLQDYYLGANGNVEITREYARIQKDA